jgi:hypothetical protein
MPGLAKRTARSLVRAGGPRGARRRATLPRPQSLFASRAQRDRGRRVDQRWWDARRPFVHPCPRTRALAGTGGLLLQGTGTSDRQRRPGHLWAPALEDLTSARPGT